MSKPARIVIHRDNTFEWDGLTFYVQAGSERISDGWGYCVYEKETLARVKDDYAYLSDIRDQFPDDYQCQWQDEDSRPYKPGDRCEWNYSVVPERFPREWLPAVVLREANVTDDGMRWLAIALVDENDKPRMSTATVFSLKHGLPDREQIRRPVDPA